MQLTYDQAEGVTKGCLGPGQAVVWQVNILGCAIYVTASNPSGLKTDERRRLIFINDNRFYVCSDNNNFMQSLFLLKKSLEIKHFKKMNCEL